MVDEQTIPEQPQKDTHIFRVRIFIDICIIAIFITFICLVIYLWYNIEAVKAFGNPCAYAQYVCKTCVNAVI